MYYLGMDIENSFKQSDRGLTNIDPNVALSENDAFINNLRQIQQDAKNEVSQQTRDLGSDVPINEGGLGGATGAFTAQYQLPQTNRMIADLRNTAQAQALSTVLKDKQAEYQRLYKDAYDAYTQRRNDKYDSYYSNSSSGNKSNDITIKDPENVNVNDDEYKVVDIENGFEVEGLMKEKLKNAMEKYVEQGMSYEDAYEQAKRDLGI